MSKIDDLLNKSKVVSVEIPIEVPPVVPMFTEMAAGDVVETPNGPCIITSVDEHIAVVSNPSRHSSMRVNIRKLSRNGAGVWRFTP